MYHVLIHHPRPHLICSDIQPMRTYNCYWFINLFDHLFNKDGLIQIHLSPEHPGQAGRSKVKTPYLMFSMSGLQIKVHHN